MTASRLHRYLPSFRGYNVSLDDGDTAVFLSCQEDTDTDPNDDSRDDSKANDDSKDDPNNDSKDDIFLSLPPGPPESPDPETETSPIQVLVVKLSYILLITSHVSLSGTVTHSPGETTDSCCTWSSVCSR